MTARVRRGAREAERGGLLDETGDAFAGSSAPRVGHNAAPRRAGLRRPWLGAAGLHEGVESRLALLLQEHDPAVQTDGFVQRL